MTMERELKSLEDHNRERSNALKGLYDAKTTGVACPKCGDELWNENPGVVLASMPPRQNAKCRTCKWFGTMVA